MPAGQSLVNSSVTARTSSEIVMTLVPSFLMHAERDRRLAVDVGVAGRVLEGAGDRRHVAEGDDGVAVGLERQRVDVLRPW